MRPSRGLADRDRPRSGAVRLAGPALVLGVAAVVLPAVVHRSDALAGDGVLRDFPVVVHAGIGTATASLPGVLPDLTFRPDRGYGYVGGEARQRRHAAATGGDPRWPLAWRENPRKYSFRVPNGEYLLGLTFLETDCAHAGVRVFDVLVEDGRPGEELVDDLDIAREVGDFHWLTKEELVTVRDGWLDIRFVSSGKLLGPRVSRIRIRPAAGIPVAPPSPELFGEGAYYRNVLRWEPPGAAGIAGYGLFRADAVEGPYASVTEHLLLSTSYVDRRVSRGGTYYYRLRAYSLRGGQSALSAPVEARSRFRLGGRLPVFELRVPPADLAGLWTRSEPAPEVSGSLLFSGRSDTVTASTETSLDAWHGKKNYRVRLESGRGFHGRRLFRFLGDAGDPTVLRERVYYGMEELAGLASPRVEPVHLVVNADYRGVFLNREAIDSRFRRRALLDRYGVLARADLDGNLPLTWRPRGEEVDGGGGGLAQLAVFYQELRRIDEGEVEKYFEERFYLDRLLNRLALAAIRGREPGALAPRLFLGDSRNGKWEFFAERPPGGALGVSSFRRPRGGDLDGEAVEWALHGPGLRGRPLPLRGWQILEARFFNCLALWRRYLDRIEEIQASSLKPAALDGLVDESYRLIEPAVADDHRWPFDGGETFRRGPGLLKEFFRAHGRALADRIARERERPPEPLVIGEFLLRPGSSETAPPRPLAPSRVASLEGAWIEIWNRSTAPVNLGAYRLSTDPDRPSAWSFPGIPLAGGARRLVTLGRGAGPFHAPLRPSPGGGVLLLSRVDARGRATGADVVFYGHQTRGFSCGRVEGESWGFLSGPTPGEPNRGPAETPPTWRYSWRVEIERNGDVTFSVKPAGAVRDVSLYLGPPEKPDFEPRPMQWSKEKYRYEISLSDVDTNTRRPFFFLARAENGLERPYPLTGSDLPLYTPTRPPLFINEVLPRPSPAGKFGEFVEIFNAGDRPVSIEGMYLTDRQRNTVKWRIPVSDPIPPGGFLVLHADGLGRGAHAPFRLSNSGEYLGLFQRYEEGNVLVDQMAFSAVPVDQSWGRREDGKKGFQRWRDPTPGKRNLPQIPEEYLRKKAERTSAEKDR